MKTEPVVLTLKAWDADAVRELAKDAFEAGRSEMAQIAMRVIGPLAEALVEKHAELEQRPDARIATAIDRAAAALREAFREMRPPVVNVAPPVVNVEVPQRPPMRKLVERDGAGRISGVVEEPAS